MAVRPFRENAYDPVPYRSCRRLQEVPAFAVCPLKTVIGDYRPDEKAPRFPEESATTRRGDKRAK